MGKFDEVLAEKTPPKNNETVIELLKNVDKNVNKTGCPMEVPYPRCLPEAGHSAVSVRIPSLYC